MLVYWNKRKILYKNSQKTGEFLQHGRYDIKRTHSLYLKIKYKIFNDNHYHLLTLHNGRLCWDVMESKTTAMHPQYTSCLMKAVVKGNGGIPEVSSFSICTAFFFVWAKVFSSTKCWCSLQFTWTNNQPIILANKSKCRESQDVPV